MLDFLMQQLLAVCLSTRYLKFLSLSFFICAKGILIMQSQCSLHKSCVRMKLDKVFKLYTTVLGEGREGGREGRRKEGENKKAPELLQNYLGEQTQFPL